MSTTDSTTSTAAPGAGTFVSELQETFLATVKKGQEFALATLSQLGEFVAPKGSAFPAVPSLPAIPGLPAIPDFVKELPKPETFVATAYEFTGAVLASQRDFADKFFANLPK